MEANASEIARQPLSDNGEAKKGFGAFSQLYLILEAAAPHVRPSEVDRLGEALRRSDGAEGAALACETWLIERRRIERRKPKKLRFPENVYANLPALLREVCSYHRVGEERDMFIGAALTVLASCLPKTGFRYKRLELSLHIYWFSLARSGAGKSVARHAFRLGAGVDNMLRKRSDEKYKTWLSDKSAYDRQFKSPAKSGSPESDLVEYPGSEPAETMLFAAGTTTAAALGLRMWANPEGPLITATEAGELAASNESTFGDFLHVLRAAHGNEPLRIDRKTQRSIRIDRAKLGIYLSGTHKQFDRFMSGGLEDGLYARFAVYETTEKPLYESQRPQTDDFEFEVVHNLVEERTTLIYKALELRRESLLITASSELWDFLDEMYQPLHDSRSDDGAFALVSIIRRNAVLAFRISSVCCIWRAYENAVDLSSVPSLELSMADLTVGCNIAAVCLEHSETQAVRLDGSVRGMSPKQREYYASLPHEYKTSEAIALGKSIKITRTTVDDWRKFFLREGLITEISHGLYRKN